MNTEDVYKMIDSSASPLEDILNNLSTRGSIRPEKMLEDKMNDIQKECDEMSASINNTESDKEREALKIALNYLTGKKNGMAYALGVIG